KADCPFNPCRFLPLDICEKLPGGLFKISGPKISGGGCMTFDEYQAEAALTASEGADCIYYAGKLVIEAAEAAQPIFKMMYHGKPATAEQMMDELGDTLWYLTGLAGSLGLSLSAIAAA